MVVVDEEHGSENTPVGADSGPARREEGGEQPELLTPGEVAELFGVDPKTVTRWAAAGKLNAQRTLGGHRRYHADEIYELLEEHGADVSSSSSG